MNYKNSIFWAFAFILFSTLSFGQCAFIEQVRLWDNSWSNPSGQSPTNYEDFTGGTCIPLYETAQPQINVSSSQGNVHIALFSDLDGNGTFETQVNNVFSTTGGIGFGLGGPVAANIPPGVAIRVIVSATPITSGDQIPQCGEAEDYVICGEDCPYIEKVLLLDGSWSNPSGQSATNYEDFTNVGCIPVFEMAMPQLNIESSQGNVYMALYSDLDGNGTFETQIHNSFFNSPNIGFGINGNVTNVPPGVTVRFIASADPITSGDQIPQCGEAEDYVICGKDCPYIEEVLLLDGSWSNPSGQSTTNYEDFTNVDCIPVFEMAMPQLNIESSQGNVYMALYSDLDGNGTFETQIHNSFFNTPNIGFGINGIGTNVPPGVTVRFIVSANPITSGDIIPQCGEAEDYVICPQDCECVNGGQIFTWNSSNCSIGFWLGGFGIDGCATLQPGYTWDFGDGVTATTFNNWTYHNYNNPGIYNVSVSFVVVDNTTGESCIQTFSKQIKTDDCGLVELLIPEEQGKSLTTSEVLTQLFDVQVFPNPSKDFVTFSVNESLTSVSGNPELVIYDQMGREVYRSEFDSNEKTIDFRTIGKGYFIYRITQNGELIGDGSLVIK